MTAKLKVKRKKLGKNITLDLGQGQVSAQVEEFKYIRILLSSEGRVKWAIDRWIGAICSDVDAVVVC